MLKIAAVQMTSGENKRTNIERALKFIDIAVENKARLVAFPELFSSRWFPCEVQKKYFNLAETVNGQTITAMKKASRKHKLIITAPFFEKYKNNYYNSCAVIDNGKLLGVYRKVHIPNIPLWEEAYYFKAGDALPVFETSIGRIGIQICWDNFFWEGYRALALKGAQLIITPTASGYNTQTRWKTVIAAQALLNTVFILRVNRTGKEKMQEFYGNSFAVAPDGVMVSNPAGMSEGIYFANIDMREVDRVRKIFPFLQGRKPALYSDIAARRKK